MPENSPLYDKFKVSRTDGADLEPEGKHYRCDYFVLDLTHDPAARPALLAYIEHCAEDRPMLAESLAEALEQTCENCGNEDPSEAFGGLYCQPCIDQMNDV